LSVVNSLSITRKIDQWQSAIDMTPERWRQIENLFQAALEREPAERAALLERECDDDPGLRNEVESLITLAERAQSFLRGNALESPTS